MGPITEIVPKELFPVGRLGAIHHVISEGALAGIGQFAIITRPGKSMIERYVREVVQRNIEGEFVFLNQDPPRGVGEAILMARNFAAGNPIVVLFPDILYPNEANPTAELLSLYAERRSSAICLVKLPEGRRSLFGSLAGERVDENTFRLTRASNHYNKDGGFEGEELSGGGRSLFTSKVFEFPAPQAAEIGDAELLNWLIENEGVLGRTISSVPSDIGSEDGYLEAVVRFHSSLNSANQRECP